MNELLQKHGCSNVFSVPDGLRELAADVSREVLRAQPPDIYEFVAKYLSALIITREHGVMATKILDELCDCRPTVSQHLIGEGFGDIEARHIAQIIKEEIEAFRPADERDKIKEYKILDRILKKVQLDEITAAKVCQVARNAYRDYTYRKMSLKKSISQPNEPWEIAAQRTLEIYKKTKPSLEELNRAAEKIQAAYKGYYVRRNLLEHLQPKSKRKDFKLNVGIAPSDISGSRHIDYGPIVSLTVKEDDMQNVFEDGAEHPYYCKARYIEKTEGGVPKPRCLSINPFVMTAAPVYQSDSDVKETIAEEKNELSADPDEQGVCAESTDGSVDAGLVGPGDAAPTSRATRGATAEDFKIASEFDIDGLSGYEICDEELGELLDGPGDTSVEESLEGGHSNNVRGVYDFVSETRVLGDNPQIMMASAVFGVKEDLKVDHTEENKTEKGSNEVIDEREEMLGEREARTVEEALGGFENEDRQTYHSISEDSGSVLEELPELE